MDFALAFEGPAVESGRMNAKQLAPALFAMASLVERSATVLYHVPPEAVQLQVKADFRRGSFEFDLVAALAVLGQQVLQNLSVSDLDLLLQWVGLKPGQDGSLISFLLRAGDKPIKEIVPTADNRVQITVHGDNAVIVVNSQVGQLLQDSEVREQASDAVEPLKREGIEALRIGDKRHPTARITKKDLPKFIPPPAPKAELTDSIAPTAVELLQPSFVEGNKWRVAQGGEPFWVTILDEAFLKQVENGEAFSKGDYLVVEMRTRTYSTPNGLEAVREVTNVLEHRRREQQGGLFER